MTAPLTRDVAYEDGPTRMAGLLVAPGDGQPHPGVLLLHDAFGLSDEMVDVARRLAALGLSVLAADVWGDRALPSTEAEIGPLIGGMVADRGRWMGRVAAAHAAAVAQPEVDPAPLVALGYCFGGAGVLEYVRTGGALRGAISVHGGLDLLAPGWDGATPGSRVLVCTGADDPMATPGMLADLQQGMDGAGVDWEVQIYSGTTHAFTSPRARHSPRPDVVAYHARSSARAWAATTRFLRELHPTAQRAA
ncbi:dienelactone hydrolase family protein [Cellulomonas sp. IC4_254]|uniref:dienelactone hydrolase family protein n=1 Tax=Cellulomonas sp. IC4_254 TaxID=2714040 RepID=UPI00141E0AF9|nr:dienelactone hydrolase family protein [Cellulomonas sp. IC4_254]NHT16108.1 hypothetical protein [Cellulomonas sp. IC4_254]